MPIYSRTIKKKVLVAAADTFRAAAIEQLETWAQRLQIEIVKGSPKSDPAAVAFDAVQAAKARECDVVLIDTAGRLHTKTPLMQELEKIKRSCQKASSSGPHETLLVLDATTGQNAIDQAKHFHKFTPFIRDYPDETRWNGKRGDCRRHSTRARTPHQIHRDRRTN